MKCVCGNEIIKKSLIKVGCLAFEGYICDKCGRSWHEEGLEAFGWKDISDEFVLESFSLKNE